MDSPAEHAAKQLMWEVETRESVEVRVTTTITNREADTLPSPIFNTVVEHYIETATGRRSSDYRGMQAGRVVNRSSHHGDGSRFMDVNYDPKDADRQQTA